jgi:hypothetical protein
MGGPGMGGPGMGGPGMGGLPYGGPGGFFWNWNLQKQLIYLLLISSKINIINYL